tara:strand:- start:2491 stop:4239 length:1749 start_codon:yes stop_codon:yes gene_type:complete
MSTVSKTIYNFLLKKNLYYVFGYSGGAILPILNEFHNSKIKFIKNATEQCSGFAAEGYSKSINKKNPGIIITTSGPGLTNIITPLQDAYNDGIPLIAISGQVPTEAIGTNAFQECNAIKLTNSCTKWNKQVKEDDNVENVLNLAYNIAMSDRKGPVHIDIPKDIMNKVINDENTTIRVKRDYNISNKLFNTIIDKINKSERPLIIAGQGCNDCSFELTHFVTSNLIPITTTLHGVGCFDETNYLSLEWLGMHGNPAANYAVQKADLIIALGTRFDDRTTGNLRKYALNAINNQGIIHIDSSSEQISNVRKLFDKYYNTSNIYTSVFSDCKFFLNKINNVILDRTNKEWIDEIKKLKQNNEYYYNEKQYILKGPDVIKSINNYLDKYDLKKNTFITTGVGNHQMWTTQYIKWKYPNKLITSGSLGTMGVGVPFAIGSKYGNINSNVIVIDGDSSFNMTSNELQTILENKLPIKIFILNDSRQQMVYIWQKLFHNNNIIATENTNPHYDFLGLSYGLDTVVCNNKTSVDSCVQKIMLNNGPVLGIFNIEPEMCYPLVSPGKALDEMIISENDIDKINKNVEAPN